MDRNHHILIGIVIALVIFVGILTYLLLDQKKEYRLQGNELRETKDTLASEAARVALLSKNLENTNQELERSEADREELSENLKDEKDRNDEFEEQIENITGTVGQLDKLSKTDSELLQKYSRVFFLNEHYTPEKLVQVDKEYLYNEDEPKFLNKPVEPFLEDMLEDALDDDITIWIVSAYRSFDEQADLKGDYLVTYGTGSNTFSADQGYSEHQLGTTFDFTTNDLNGGIDGFETTPAYEWLTENAHKYGFVLSYPEDNQYYVFEPWHWRFVGEELARDLHEDDEHFYDLEQRDLNEYLISIFD